MNKKSKVLIVIQPTDGGSAFHVQQLLSGLNKSRFEVHLAASGCEAYKKACQENSVQYHVVPFTRSLNPLASIGGLLQLANIFRSNNFEVIHLHSTTAGLLGRIAAVGLKAKVVYTPHSPLYFQLAGIKQKIFYWAERATMWLVDLVILVSPSEQDKVVQDGLVSINKCEVVVNGVSLPKLSNRNSRKPVITMISRLEKQKRQQDLIMAAPLVLKEFPKAEIRLIGEGSRRGELQKLINELGLGEKVLLLGHKNDAAGLWSQSTVAVQCSETEGLPYTILEAMAAGLPVVGTEVEGIVDLVVEEKTGLLYRKGDYQQLASDIIFMLNNPTVSHKYGQLARRIVKSEYSVSAMLEKTERVYVSK